MNYQMSVNTAKFSIGDVVKHKHFNFRGVIYDVDFEFNNSQEWYESIPKDVRPKKDQPFYHLLAENNEITYEAYVSEQNLINDDSDEPIKHPLIEEIFTLVILDNLINLTRSALNLTFFFQKFDKM